MKLSIKDDFYDVLTNPTKADFRYILQNNLGEEDYLDFKKEWVTKEKEARHIMAMANSGGGCIIFGVAQKKDGTLEPTGLDSFKDLADLKNEIDEYVPDFIKYQLKDLSYDNSEYDKMIGKKFQILIVEDTPEALPFICCKDGTGLKNGDIYVRNGTESTKANNYDIENIINRKINALKIPRKNNLKLNEHLEQLKELYGQLEYTMTTGGLFANLGIGLSKLWGEKTIEKKDCYPKEDYDDYIVRILEKKKKRIEEELDI